MYEKRDAERLRILTEVAKWILDRGVIKDPIDETEHHVNHVIADLAARIRQDRMQ